MGSGRADAAPRRPASAAPAARARPRTAAPAPMRAPRELSGGRPLPPTTRERMEAAFGVPLDHVRLHTDADASDLADVHGADALALGRHIAFAAGRLSLETEEGARLLAHELAHVVQQQGDDDERAPQGPDSEPGEPAEREADAAAARVVRGEAAGVTPGAAAWTTRARIMRRARAGAEAARDDAPAPKPEATEPEAAEPARGDAAAPEAEATEPEP